ncbi:hypothetical protein R1sor_020379 [Riccia sorocarpa]|uniref:Uncharacterized protein n=1 Tax=Riccia sorocarpa TaxID=122646 RepID=A0ABD3IJP7_9MARC
MDQTGLHLVPVFGERTYARKDAREIAVFGKDDRRQITVAVSSTAAGELLSLQLNFGFNFAFAPRGFAFDMVP